MKVITGLFKAPKVSMPTPTPAPAGPDPEKVQEEAQRDRIKAMQSRRGRSLTLASGDSGTLMTGGNRSTLG